jgi:hypothetical protein
MTMWSGGDHSATGWTTTGSIPSRPALVHLDTGQPTLVLTCQQVSTTVQVRGLQPEQAWPQSSLSLAFGDIERSYVPDVRNVGDQIAFEGSFQISDEVLAAISNREPIRVRFSGQELDYPGVPVGLSKEFSDGCAALVPPGMRVSEPE